MQGPLKLYWWNNTPNFGDAISQDIVAHVSGRSVEWAAPEECDLFAVGSIMQPVLRDSVTAQAVKPWVWGTGCLHPMRRDFVNNVQFAAVRGPLTAEWLGANIANYGDPALLMPNVLVDAVETKDIIGIVPHFSQLEKTQAAVKGFSQSIRVLDVREDRLDVVRQIAACRLVLSSSLHGLIVADAFGVPNIWLDPRGNHRSPLFKFYDYATSVGRGLPRPVALSELPDALRAADGTTIQYGDGIKQAQSDLAKSFPKELCAITEEALV